MTPGWLRWPQTQALIKAFAPDSLRFVGGAVRDALLERDVTDVDAATTCTPEETMAVLEKAGIRAIPTGIAHGTVTAVMEGKTFEITTLRRDVTTDGRHAEVAYTDNWQEDAARRDFTMNALYLSPEGELFDYFGGETDAREGRVRFIGDPSARAAEDYLRVLRFFRFYAWYGKGVPDRESLIACIGAAPHLDSLSGERVRAEILKLLAAPAAYATLRIMQSTYILPHVLGFDVGDCTIFSALEDMDPAIKLAGFVLKASVARRAALDIMTQRLRLSNAEAKALSAIIVNYNNITETIPVTEQKKWVRALGANIFSHIVMLKRAEAVYTSPACGGGKVGESAAMPKIPPFIPPQAGGIGEIYDAMLALADSWQVPVFPVTGDDLIAKGIVPGKAMGEALKRLEEAWENSDYTWTKEELLKQ